MIKKYYQTTTTKIYIQEKMDFKYIKCVNRKILAPSLFNRIVRGSSLGITIVFPISH